MTVKDTTYCERHPAEPLSLSCGGCYKRICTVCMTLTGEGPRCSDCMAKLNGTNSTAATPVEGVVISAGDTAARTDAAREAYYATEPKVYCARHPQTETLLRCGRCDTPICPRCMVHAGVGIRCPECAANPQRTVGRQAEIAAAQARGKNAPTDTGHRNYWYKNRAYSIIEPKHYLLAALVGLGVAIGAGVLWGFLLSDMPIPGLGQRAGLSARQFAQFFVNADPTAWQQFIISSVASSVHLIPEVVLGLAVGAAIEQVTNHRVGPGLQVIGGVAVALGLFISIVTVAARIYLAGTGSFPPVGDLLSVSLGAVSRIITTQLGVLLFWLLGIGIAVVRLKR